MSKTSIWAHCASCLCSLIYCFQVLLHSVSESPRSLWAVAYNSLSWILQYKHSVVEDFLDQNIIGKYCLRVSLINWCYFFFILQRCKMHHFKAFDIINLLWRLTLVLILQEHIQTIQVVEETLSYWIGTIW